MKPSTLFWLFLLITLSSPGFISAQSHSAVSVPLCDLLKNPKTYDGKPIQVRGRINLEFEDFTIYDMHCNYSPDVWLMFGGDVATPIASMWGDTKRPKGKNIQFAGVEYPLIKDASFDEFMKHVTARRNKKPVYRVTASLEGVLFGQHPNLDSNLETDSPGYGHMGCCRLLIVKRISDVQWKESAGDFNEKWSQRREPPAKQ
jgi:hypothetical protein